MYEFLEFNIENIRVLSLSFQFMENEYINVWKI